MLELLVDNVEKPMLAGSVLDRFDMTTAPALIAGGPGRT